MTAQQEIDGMMAAIQAGMTRRNPLQEPGSFGAFEAARAAMLERWIDVLRTLTTTDAILEASGTSWAMIETAMLFKEGFREGARDSGGRP